MLAQNTENVFVRRNAARSFRPAYLRKKRNVTPPKKKEKEENHTNIREAGNKKTHFIPRNISISSQTATRRGAVANRFSSFEVSSSASSFNAVVTGHLLFFCLQPPAAVN